MDDNKNNDVINSTPIPEILCKEHGFRCQYIGVYRQGCDCYSAFEYHNGEHFIRHFLCSSCESIISMHNYLIDNAKKEIDHIYSLIADQVNAQQKIIEHNESIIRPKLLVGQKEVDVRRTRDIVNQMTVEQIKTLSDNLSITNKQTLQESNRELHINVDRALNDNKICFGQNNIHHKK